MESVNKTEKVAHENLRAEKIQQKRHKQEEKRKNSLPPFLMVRSGLATSWIMVLMGAVFTVLIEKQPNVAPDDKLHNIALGLCMAFTVLSTQVAGFITIKNKKRMQEDIDIIRDKMSEYVRDPNHMLNLDSVRNFPKMTTLLVRHITKTNPGVFDRFIANPQSISDNEAMQDIIIGYLDKHSDDAPKILDALHKLQQSMPNNKDGQCGLRDDDQQIMEIENDVLPVSYELRRRLERYARRVAGPTKRR